MMISRSFSRGLHHSVVKSGLLFDILSQ